MIRDYIRTYSSVHTASRCCPAARIAGRCLLSAVVFTSCFMTAAPAVANPEGGNVIAGSATIDRVSARRLDIRQTTNKAVIDWRSFSIAADEHTNFDQASANAIVLNRVAGGTPSQILGRLTATGQIMLINPNGILFGPDATVDVAGLVATTADIRNEDFLSGNYNFGSAGNPQASIVNQGNISIADQGLLAFVAPGVVNTGVINARLGRISLAAGNRFTLDLYGDRLVTLAVDDEVATRVLGADGEQLDSLIKNNGTIAADGGSVALTARAAREVVDNVINTSGVIRARSVGVENGEIVLYGGNHGKVTMSGTMDVSGDAGGGSIDIKGEMIQTTADAAVIADATADGNGGTITAYAERAGNYNGTFSARGGANGGDGGFIETSGRRVRIADDIEVDTSALQGLMGQWSIDPVTLDIVASGGGSFTTTLPVSNGNESTIAAATVVNALQNNNVNLQATGTINVKVAIDSSDQTNSNILSFIDQNTDDNLILNLTADILLGDNQTLTGQATTVNVSGSARIQDGIDAAASGARVNVGAGIYNESLDIGKALTLEGTTGARIAVSDGPSTSYPSFNGINIHADDVTITGLEIFGPVDESYLDYAWGSRISRGIAVANGATGFMIANNNIHDVRNGILIDGRNNTGNVTGNVIENTKSGISVQYTDASGIAISGNTEGPIGNEWGLNLHLNGFLDGGTINANPHLAAPPLAWQQSLLDLSNSNGGWSVQDQGYASSNRTRVRVATTGSPGSQGSLLTPVDSIQGGIGAVVNGGQVNVAAGTYTQSTTLSVNKSLTLSGAGRDDVIIDARTIGNKYGISVSANDVSLNNFTVYGSANYTPSAYGIKVSPGGPPTSRLTNFSINNVRSRGAGKAELDLNGVNGATITNFIADGAPVGNDAGTTQGAGIQLTDTANLIISNTTTRNNAWGGVALYQANRSYDQQTGNITIAVDNNFTESNPLYAQDESAINDFGTLTLNGYQYAVQNVSFREGIPLADSQQFTFFQKTENDAINYALTLYMPNNSIVRKNNSATYIDTNGDANLDADGSFIVGTNGTDVMSIQAAVDNAAAGDTISVNAGSYSPFKTNVSGPEGLSIIGSAGTQISLSGLLPLQRIVDLRADGTTFKGFSINGGGTHVGISISGQGVTVSDNTIENVLTGIQTTTRYIAGNNTITGNTIKNSGYGISLQNNSNTVANNIIDVETEGLGIGSSGNTISNNELSIGISGNHLQTYTKADYDKLPGADINLLQVLADNEFDRAAYITNGSNVAVQTIFGGIQSAVDEAAGGAGDTVNVTSGSYDENITLNKSIGLAFSNVTLSGLSSVQGTTTSLSGQLSTNTLNFAGATRLSGSTTINTGANNGNITFTGEINGTTANAQNLTLNAGQGTVRLNDVGRTVALGNLTVTAGDYDASSGTTNVRNLTVNGRNISAGNHTVNALGNVLLKGSNVSGTINATKVSITATNNVNTNINSLDGVFVSGNNVSGQIAGQNVNISAVQNINSTITAANNATIKGSIIQASVRAPKADVTATQSVQLEATVNNLQVASGGRASVSGSVDNLVVASGSQPVSLNNVLVSSQSGSGLDRNGGMLQPEQGTLSVPLILATLTLEEAAFGNNAGDVFASNFSLGLSPDTLTAMPSPEETSSEKNEDLRRFLYDFWGYYFSE
jgi:filamentous hemagglutinin family protein